MKQVASLCVLGLVGLAGQASAQSVEYIQLPRGFYTNGMSADGSVVVGHKSQPTVAPHYWTEATGLVRMYGPNGETWPAKAWACSEDGSVIVGTVLYDNSQVPFRWTAATGIVPLPNLRAGNGYDVSNDGTVFVGDASEDQDASGFVWDMATGSRDLFAPAEAGHGGIACVSGDGAYAIGTGALDDSGAYVRWDLANGTAEALVMESAGNYWIRGNAYDCNYDGQIVVGLVNDPALGGRQASIWTVNGIELLGSGSSMAVSGDGLLVGGYDNGASWVWTPGLGRVSIASYLSTNFSFTPPEPLRYLGNISDDGRTIASGFFTSSGWLIRLPVSRPADFDRNEFVDFHDLSDYLDCFEGNHLLPVSTADLNRDGMTDFFDLMQFIDDFER